jgi:hypothetical protein
MRGAPTRSRCGTWAFTNLLDPEPQSRRVFLFEVHRPEKLHDGPIQAGAHGKDLSPG